MEQIEIEKKVRRKIPKPSVAFKLQNRESRQEVKRQLKSGKNEYLNNQR